MSEILCDHGNNIFGCFKCACDQLDYDEPENASTAPQAPHDDSTGLNLRWPS